MIERRSVSCVCAALEHGGGESRDGQVCLLPTRSQRAARASAIRRASLLTLNALFFLSKEAWNVPHVPTHKNKNEHCDVGLFSPTLCCWFLHIRTSSLQYE